MKKRLFGFNMLIVCGSLLVFFISSLFVTYHNNLLQTKHNVITLATVYKQFYEADKDFIEHHVVPEDVRVTIVAQDGTVLIDSKPLDESTLENHIDREEIQRAMLGDDENTTATVRHSDTLGFDMVYYATEIKTNDGLVYLRTSIPIQEINRYVNETIPLLILLFLLTVISSLLISRKISAKLLIPYDLIKNSLQSINDGRYVKIPNTNYDEINAITSEIDEVADNLDQSIFRLTKQKNKLRFLLDNVGDVIFAVNSNEELILLNARTKQLFNVTDDVVEHHISSLTIDKTLVNNIHRCLTEKGNITFETTIDDKIFKTSLKNISSSWTDQNGSLCVAVLSDITDSKNAQKRREEFFANASHELKTPLTSIKGFNELTEIHNQDEKLNKYLAAIKRETDRMLLLISDMLNLSDIENTSNLNTIDVDLGKTTNEVICSLEQLISENNIDVKIIGNGVVHAEYKHIYDLIKNLIENAIKYNVENGKVNVKLADNSIIVEDTGIGIPHADQSQIFERFYRVQKSRSKLSGGTGLGLAIVKHICSLYDAQIFLKSAISKGTQIQINF